MEKKLFIYQIYEKLRHQLDEEFEETVISKKEELYELLKSRLFYLFHLYLEIGSELKLNENNRKIPYYYVNFNSKKSCDANKNVMDWNEIIIINRYHEYDEEKMVWEGNLHGNLNDISTISQVIVKILFEKFRQFINENQLENGDYDKLIEILRIVKRLLELLIFYSNILPHEEMSLVMYESCLMEFKWLIKKLIEYSSFKNRSSIEIVKEIGIISNLLVVSKTWNFEEVKWNNFEIRFLIFIDHIYREGNGININHNKNFWKKINLLDFDRIVQMDTTIVDCSKYELYTKYLQRIHESKSFDIYKSSTIDVIEVILKNLDENIDRYKLKGNRLNIVMIIDSLIEILSSIEENASLRFSFVKCGLFERLLRILTESNRFESNHSNEIELINLKINCQSDDNHPNHMISQYSHIFPNINLISYIRSRVMTLIVQLMENLENVKDIFLLSTTYDEFIQNFFSIDQSEHQTISILSSIHTIEFIIEKNILMDVLKEMKEFSFTSFLHHLFDNDSINLRLEHRHYRSLINTYKYFIPTLFQHLHLQKSNKEIFHYLLQSLIRLSPFLHDNFDEINPISFHETRLQEMNSIFNDQLIYWMNHSLLINDLMELFILFQLFKYSLRRYCRLIDIDYFFNIISWNNLLTNLDHSHHHVNHPHQRYSSSSSSNENNENFSILNQKFQEMIDTFRNWNGTANELIENNQLQLFLVIEMIFDLLKFSKKLSDIELPSQTNQQMDASSLSNGSFIDIDSDSNNIQRKFLLKKFFNFHSDNFDLELSQQKFPSSSLPISCLLWMCLSPENELESNQQIYSIYSIDQSTTIDVIISMECELILIIKTNNDISNKNCGKIPLDGYWHQLVVVHTPSKRPFGFSSKLFVYFDMNLLMKCSFVYPNFSNQPISGVIGRPITVDSIQIRNKKRLSFNATHNFSSSRLTSAISSSSLSSSCSSSTTTTTTSSKLGNGDGLGKNSSFPSSIRNFLQKKILPSNNDEINNENLSDRTHLNGFIGSFHLFLDQISWEDVRALYEIGPNDTPLLLQYQSSFLANFNLKGMNNHHKTNESDLIRYSQLSQVNFPLILQVGTRRNQSISLECIDRMAKLTNHLFISIDAHSFDGKKIINYSLYTNSTYYDCNMKIHEDEMIDEHLARYLKMILLSLTSYSIKCENLIENLNSIQVYLSHFIHCYNNNNNNNNNNDDYEDDDDDLPFNMVNRLLKIIYFILSMDNENLLEMIINLNFIQQLSFIFFNLQDIPFNVRTIEILKDLIRLTSPSETVRRGKKSLIYFDLIDYFIFNPFIFIQLFQYEQFQLMVNENIPLRMERFKDTNSFLFAFLYPIVVADMRYEMEFQKQLIIIPQISKIIQTHMSHLYHFNILLQIITSTRSIFTSQLFTSIILLQLNSYQLESKDLLLQFIDEDRIVAIYDLMRLSMRTFNDEILLILLKILTILISNVNDDDRLINIIYLRTDSVVVETSKLPNEICFHKINRNLFHIILQYFYESHRIQIVNGKIVHFLSDDLMKLFINFLLMDKEMYLLDNIYFLFELNINSTPTIRSYILEQLGMIVDSMENFPIIDNDFILLFSHLINNSSMKIDKKYFFLIFNQLDSFQWSYLIHLLSEQSIIDNQSILLMNLMELSFKELMKGNDVSPPQIISQYIILLIDLYEKSSIKFNEFQSFLQLLINRSMFEKENDIFHLIHLIQRIFHNENIPLNHNESLTYQMDNIQIDLKNINIDYQKLLTFFLYDQSINLEENIHESYMKCMKNLSNELNELFQKSSPKSFHRKKMFTEKIVLNMNSMKTDFHHNLTNFTEYLLLCRQKSFSLYLHLIHEQYHSLELDKRKLLELKNKEFIEKPNIDKSLDRHQLFSNNIHNLKHLFRICVSFLFNDDHYKLDLVNQTDYSLRVNLIPNYRYHNYERAAGERDNYGNCSTDLVEEENQMKNSRLESIIELLQQTSKNKSNLLQSTKSETKSISDMFDDLSIILNNQLTSSTSPVGDHIRRNHKLQMFHPAYYRTNTLRSISIHPNYQEDSSDQIKKKFHEHRRNFSHHQSDQHGYTLHDHHPSRKNEIIRNYSQMMETQRNNNEIMDEAFIHLFNRYIDMQQSQFFSIYRTNNRNHFFDVLPNTSTTLLSSSSSSSSLSSSSDLHRKSIDDNPLTTHDVVGRENDDDDEFELKQLNSEDIRFYEFDVNWIRTNVECSGILLVTDYHLHFYANSSSFTQHFLNNYWDIDKNEKDVMILTNHLEKKKKKESSIDFIDFFRQIPYCFLNEQEDELHFILSLTQIRSVFPRRYTLEKKAIEIFLIDNRSFFLNVGEQTKWLNHLNLSKNVGTNPFKGITTDWCNGHLTNFEYLMLVNMRSGRSNNDLSQYYIFPWVISSFKSSNSDDTRITYRNLGYPIGALDEETRENLRKKYDMFHDPSGTIQKFHHGSHYSNPACVIHYLMRMEPFTGLHVALQNGRFDVADRQFYSIEQSIDGILTHPTDAKELIPEFYYFPEFLRNLNNLKLGMLQNRSMELNDVILPSWCNSSTELFVQQHRQWLDSDIVRKHLPKWMDLIFGYKQSGQLAIDALNVYMYYSYENNIDLDSIDSLITRNSLKLMINQFGQIPEKIFTKRHPSSFENISHTIITTEKRKMYEIILSSHPIIWFLLVETGLSYNRKFSSNNSSLNLVPITPMANTVTPTKLMTTFTFHSTSPSNKLLTINDSFLFGCHDWHLYKGGISSKFEFNPMPSTRMHQLPINNNNNKNSMEKIFEYSHKFQLLYVGGYWDSSIRIFHLNEQKQLKFQSSVRRLHNHSINVIKLSECEQYLLTGDRSGTIVFWKQTQHSNDLFLTMNEDEFISQQFFSTSLKFPSSSSTSSITSNSTTNTITNTIRHKTLSLINSTDNILQTYSSIGNYGVLATMPIPIYVIHRHKSQITSLLLISSIKLIISGDINGNVYIHRLNDGSLISHIRMKSDAIIKNRMELEEIDDFNSPVQFIKYSGERHLVFYTRNCFKKNNLKLHLLIVRTINGEIISSRLTKYLLNDIVLSTTNHLISLTNCGKIIFHDLITLNTMKKWNIFNRSPNTRIMEKLQLSKNEKYLLVILNDGKGIIITTDEESNEQK
ncbi:hypothetical protein SNEBB_003428 [Seison nebaliae]|nr:hypothetical protein SNEBB_003428 [Seison nebaliae]